MCGIAGILRAAQEPIPPGQIDAMVAALRHRGPDGEGTFFAPGIGLGHTRLAIIDLSDASAQPFVDEAAGLALVFNGAIYNYLELRRELTSLGLEFRSDGDTEVLLRAYEAWGPGCLHRLNGMFAFAIWDARKRELFLARDRFGEKPLYLARSPRGVAFASEMKAILAIRPELREPNREAVYRYLARGDLDLDAQSFFEGIESLPAAHSLVLDSDGHGEPRRYWQPTSDAVPAGRAAAIERFRELLFDAVRIRLRSDVTVGSSLSGGIDSSSIVAAIDAQKGSQPVHQQTFSARFHAKHLDEGHYIDLLTRRVEAEAHDIWIEPEAFLASFDQLQWHQEEPIASASPFAQWGVMSLARAHETTVLLDGQGADELLAGYDQAHGMFWAHWLRKARLDHVARELFAHTRRYGRPTRSLLFTAYYLLPGGLRDGLAERYFGSSHLVSPELHREFAPSHVDSLAPFPDRLRNELVRWQTVTQLPEYLRYADRNSMAFGREVRLPFLDHRLAEYAMGLPADLLLRGAVTKVVLRQAMRGIVPDEVLDRKDKLAYAPPQREWLRGPLRPWIEGVLHDAERRDDIFNPAAVVAVRENPSRPGHEALTWRIASTEAWFQRMVERPSVQRREEAELSPLNW